tara:strand:+ start:1649 stop:1891 length:243 start_codon:yes stop_codon:yes gene_type:complete
MPGVFLNVALVFLVACALLSTVSADRLSAVAKARGYDPRVINQRAVEEAKLKPKRQPIVKRAAETMSACTTPPPPNPTAP